MTKYNLPLSKPLPCNQAWDNMLATEGGRICTGCGKLVVDFRNHKWREIDRAQRENIVPLCGIYDPKQIENWGSELTQPISVCTKMIRLSAALIAFSQIAPGNLPAQTNTTQHQLPSSKQKTKQNLPAKPKTNASSAKRIISGTVVTQVNDTAKLPLACAELTLVRGTKVITTETDSFGRFSLDLSNVYSSLHDTFEIVVTHPRHSTHTVKYARNDLRPNERNLIDVVLGDVSVIGSQYHRQLATEVFSVMPSSHKEPIPTKPISNPPSKKESRAQKWWRHLWKDKK